MRSTPSRPVDGSGSDGRDRPLTILLVSHTADDGIFKVGSHHLAREWAQAGHRVAHISTPASTVHLILNRADPTRRRLALEGSVVDADGVIHGVPRTHLPVQFDTRGRKLLRFVDRIGFANADLVFVDQPLMAPLFKGWRRAPLIYRPTDTYPTGVGHRRQRFLINRARAVVATSEHVLAELALPTVVPHMVARNGVQLDAMSQNKNHRGARVVYVGALDGRFDWDALRAMAEAVREARFEIAGPMRSVAPDLPDNVKLLGPVPYDKIGAMLSSAAVGLLPFNAAEQNTGRSPMKFYEYLASGLYVVGAWTPSLASRNAPGSYMYRNHAEAIVMLRRAISHDLPNLAGMESALEESWTKRAEEILDFAIAHVLEPVRRQA